MATLDLEGFEDNERIIDQVQLKKDLEFIKEGVKGILLFGSAAREELSKRSDIDICLVKPKGKRILLEVFERLGGRYDVKIFEDLPLYIKMDIIKGHKTIFGDESDISYYFYRFRREWEGMKHRIEENQFSNIKEMLTNRRRWLNEKKIFRKT